MLQLRTKIDFIAKLSGLDVLPLIPTLYLQQIIMHFPDHVIKQLCRDSIFVAHAPI